MRRILPGQEGLNRYELLYNHRRLEGEGRALAEHLARGYLYQDLVRMNYRYLPIDPNDREDFLHDFFLDICCIGAPTFNRGSFSDTENLRDNSDAVKWLMVCLRRFYREDGNLKLRRIKLKKNHLPRPVEVSIYDSVYPKRNGHSTGSDGNGNGHSTSSDRIDNRVSRLAEVSYEIFLNNRKKQFSGLSPLESDELEELEHTKRMIRMVVQEALSGLKNAEREIFEMYFFEGRGQKEISKIKRMTIGKVRWFVRVTKGKLRETLPYSITSTRRWNQG